MLYLKLLDDLVNFIFLVDFSLIKGEIIMNNERSVVAVLEDVTFILNEIRNNKFRKLEGTKLSSKQEEILENIEKDIEVCVTKLGKLIHMSEL